MVPTIKRDPIARAASCNPDPQWLDEGMAAHQRRDHLVSQIVKHFCIAEKRGDVDQQVLGEKPGFGCILVQHVEVARKITAANGHRHAPLDPPLQRAGLVEREIMGGFGAQPFNNVVQAVGRWRCPAAGAEFCWHWTFVAVKNGRDFRHRQHLIHQTGGNRTARHAVKGGFLRLLGDDFAAARVDRLNSKAAIAAGAGQHHGHGPCAIFQRQRIQQEIERQPGSVCCGRLRHLQRALSDSQIGTGRDDVEMAWLNRHSIDGLVYFECRMRGKQTCHQALVRGVQMLDQDEGHACVLGNMIDEPGAGFQPSSRCPDPHHEETGGFQRKRDWRKGCLNRWRGRLISFFVH